MSAWKGSFLIFLICTTWSSVVLSKDASTRSSGSSSKLKPKAYIHIGLTKTGSSHLQGYLHHVREALVEINFFQPKFDKGIGAAYQGDLAFQLMHPDNSTDFAHFVHRSQHMKRNVVISSDTLSVMPDAGVETLADYFSGYDTTIIMSYRDLLSRCMSAYRKSMGDVSILLPEFFQYAEIHLELLRKEQFDAIDLYGKYFGLDRIVVIEYQGMLDSGKDEVYIVLCEIMQVMCDETAELNKEHPSEEANQQTATPAQVSRELVNIAEMHAMTENTACKYFNPKERHHYLHIAESYLHELYQKNLTVPVQTMSLQKFKNYTVAADRQIRNDYEFKAWLHGAMPRVDEERRKLQCEHLDSYQLFSDVKFWQGWFNGLLSLLDLGNTCSSKIVAH